MSLLCNSLHLGLELLGEKDVAWTDCIGYKTPHHIFKNNWQ